MDAITSISLGLTAGERWAAARRMSPRSVPEQWLVLLGVAVMLVLVVVLLAISLRRRQQNRRRGAEEFDLEALRRGLTVRERQILLAIAVRSGRRQTSAVFQTAEAFQRGAAQLLTEFAQTHTPQENTQLNGEVLRLRQKLGLRATGPGQVRRERPSSRDIPTSKWIELIGDKEHAAVPIRAQVLRNDEKELVAALPTPVSSKAGEPWLAHYYSGMTAWEFRTSTVRCDGKKLILNHSEEIHFINRRKFPRVPVRARALVALLPLLRNEVLTTEEASPSAEDHEAGAMRPMVGGRPRFVESIATEFAGPGLRLETWLPVRVDDRVLVVVPLARGTDGGATARHTLAAVGRVKHSQNIEPETGVSDAIDHVWEGAPQGEPDALTTQRLSIAVELVGLNDEEIEALASLTDELSSHVPDHDVGGAMEPERMPASVTTP